MCAYVILCFSFYLAGVQSLLTGMPLARVNVNSFRSYYSSILNTSNDIDETVCMYACMYVFIDILKCMHTHTRAHLHIHLQTITSFEIIQPSMEGTHSPSQGILDLLPYKLLKFREGWIGHRQLQGPESETCVNHGVCIM